LKSWQEPDWIPMGLLSAKPKSKRLFFLISESLKMIFWTISEMHKFRWIFETEKCHLFDPYFKGIEVFDNMTPMSVMKIYYPLTLCKIFKNKGPTTSGPPVITISSCRKWAWLSKKNSILIIKQGMDYQWTPNIILSNKR